MDIKHCDLITNVEFDNSLVLIHWNIRCVNHKNDEINNLWNMDRVNPHILFLVKSNLHLNNLENCSWDLVLHVVFTRKIVYVFLLEETYVILLLISLNTVKKIYQDLCYTVTVKTIHLILICIYFLNF